MASDRMMEYYYSMGQDCLRGGSPDDAVAYFKKAANLGTREAAYEICAIGHRWETGSDGLEKDEKKAEYCYKISAEYGIVEANLLLGKLYFRGIAGSGPNPRKARKALEKACDGGSAEAASLLGKMYDEGIMGNVNPGKAFCCYLLAAERGDSAAMLMTGLFYAQGTSTAKDVSAAEMWIRRGCEKGDPDGKAVLRGFLSVACGEYITGAAGRVDPEKAEAMAEEAEALGSKEAFCRLGEALLLKKDTPDYGEKAFQCFKRAARHRVPFAYARLGLCYEAGIGTAADIRKSVKYYRKSAESGDPFGMAHLGYALANGEGVRKNEKEAMEWLIRAAMHGDSGAIKVLKEDYNYTL